jgi:hypothetical protein
VISASGLYTAPNYAGTSTVTATSQADPTKSASATVTVQVVSITVSPTTATIYTNATQQFSAYISGTPNTAVTWTSSGGTVNSSGLYTAPASAGSYTVTATSQADTSKSAVATVNVQAQSVSITISPAAATIYVSKTQQFTASVSGTTNTTVTWTASGGTVNSSGLYTAPSTAGSYTVTATSQADTTKSATAAVTVDPTIQHTVTLNWNYSDPFSYFNVLRAAGACSGFSPLGTSLSTSYVDGTVVSGQTYCYTNTATYNGLTSLDSNQINVAVPYP